MQTIYYIDPGTGGMIAGSFWNIILVALGILAGFFLSIFKPIRRTMSKLCQRIRKKQ